VNTSDDKYRITTIHAGNEKAAGEAIGLLTSVFGPSFYSAAYWRWKYCDNPFGESILVEGRAASSDDTMAGFRAFWRWRFWCQGREIDAAQPCDTAVHKSCRRAGLFSRMTNRAVKQAKAASIDVLFNNPNPEAERGYLKLGWVDLGGLRWYARPVNKVPLLKELVRWRGKTPEAVYSNPESVWTGSMAEPGVGGLLDAYRSEHPGLLTTARSCEFLRWRYSASPHRKYGAEFVGEGTRVDAMVFYGIAGRGTIREVQILDVIALRSAATALSAALEIINDRERPDWMVFASSKGFPLAGALRQCGFLRIPRTSSLIGRQIGSVEAPDLDSLGMTLGDLDTF